MATFEPIARALGSLTAPRGRHATLTVLLYHRVLGEPDPLAPELLDSAGFDRHISCLSQVFRILSLDDALRRLRHGTLPPRALCITFDDGYRDNIDVAIPVLQRHDAVATFFVSTGFLGGGRMLYDTVVETVRRLPANLYELEWIGLGRRAIGDIESRRTFIAEFMRRIQRLSFEERAEACERLAFGVQSALPTDLMMTLEHVRALPALRMSVGAHTHDHPILAHIDAREASAQIVRSRDVLAGVLGSEPTLFAYPSGKPDIDYSSAHVEMVKRAGFSGAVSVSMGTATRDSDHFQVPRFVPWDRDPRHLALRILAQPWRHRGTPMAQS